MAPQKSKVKSQKSKVRSYGFSILSSLLCLLSLIFFSCSHLLANEGKQTLIKVVQGGAFFFKLEVDEEIDSVRGSLLGREIPFFKYKEGGLYGALIGIDIEDEAKNYRLMIEFLKKDGTSLNKSYPIKVIPGGFKTEDLTLPKEMVELDDETLKRVANEKEKTGEVLSKVTADRFWDGDFIIPAQGRVVENFGSRRRLNGQARAPHTGIDIAAPSGTEVHASNDGIVVLVDDLFFAGKSIFIDHGLGLYTFYSHLSQINVSKGDRIRKGDPVGRVGSSGRATGPHLHWGMKINGARVNPLSVVGALKE